MNLVEVLSGAMTTRELVIMVALVVYGFMIHPKVVKAGIRGAFNDVDTHKALDNWAVKSKVLEQETTRVIEHKKKSDQSEINRIMATLRSAEEAIKENQKAFAEVKDMINEIRRVSERFEANQDAMEKRLDKIEESCGECRQIQINGGKQAPNHHRV